MICPFCHKDSLKYLDKVEFRWDANDDTLGRMTEYYECTNDKCEGSRGVSLWMYVRTPLDTPVTADDYKGRRIATAVLKDIITDTADFWDLDPDRLKEPGCLGEKGLGKRKIA